MNRSHVTLWLGSSLIALGLASASAAAILVMGAAQASAADLGVTPNYVAPPAQPQGAYDWSGLFIGANVGYGWENTNWENIYYFGTPYSLHVATTDGSGLLGGGSIGFNHQVGSMVFGLEGDFDLTGMNGSGDCIGQFGDYSATCTSKVNWLADITARLGYAAGRTLFFAKGGVAFGNFTYDAINIRHTGGALNGDPDYYPSSQTRTGFVLGGGFDHAITDRVAMTFEVDYMNFGTERVDFTPPYVGSRNFPFGTDISESTILAKVGLSVKLN